MLGPCSVNTKKKFKYFLSISSSLFLPLAQASTHKPPIQLPICLQTVKRTSIYPFRLLVAWGDATHGNIYHHYTIKCPFADIQTKMMCCCFCCGDVQTVVYMWTTEATPCLWNNFFLKEGDYFQVLTINKTV